MVPWSANLQLDFTCISGSATCRYLTPAPSRVKESVCIWFISTPWWKGWFCVHTRHSVPSCPFYIFFTFERFKIWPRNGCFAGFIGWALGLIVEKSHPKSQAMVQREVESQVTEGQGHYGLRMCFPSKDLGTVLFHISLPWWAATWECSLYLFLCLFPPRTHLGDQHCTFRTPELSLSHEVERMISACIIRGRTKKPSRHQWFAIQCSWIIFYDIVQTLLTLGNSYLSHSGLRLGPLGFLSCFLEQTQKLWTESSASLSEHHAATRLVLASMLPIMPNFKLFRVSFYSS